MTASFEIMAIGPSPLLAQVPFSSKQNLSSLANNYGRISDIAFAAAQAGHLGITDLAYIHSDSDKEINKFFNKILLSLSSSKKHVGLLGLRIDEIQLENLIAGLTNNSIKKYDYKDGGFTIIVTPDLVARHNSSTYIKNLKESIKKLRKVLNSDIRILIEITSAKEAVEISSLDVDGLIAKGHEAAGVVGDQTAFVLLQECVSQVKMPIYIWGGIGLHTAAACKAMGAAGVMLDSQLWLTKESPLPLALKAKIEQFDGTESHVISLDENEQSNSNLGLRIYTRPNYEFEISKTKTITAAYSQIAKHNTDNAPINWVVPVGQDIAFAKDLAQKYISVAAILHAIEQSIEDHITFAQNLKPLAPGSSLAASHGTTYPIVQGAMTRVSDKSNFASAIAKAGGLPFLALALMRNSEADPLLNETKTLLADQPWGVGILGFVPTELRQEQMAVLKKYKPPYVLIAGGRPDQAKQLEELGIKTYLHVPSPLLLDSFMEMGCRRFVFEGKECGGHVGPRSSFVLWETMIDHLLNNINPREDASAYHILFAGGIHDARSAAAVSAMAAPLAARGLKIGVLMGTAYLFTQEAVESGAIVKTFQTAALKCEETVLLETGPGHAIRCVNSPYKQIFDSKRRSLITKGKSKDEIREELEFANLGRLRLASKGLVRADFEQGLDKNDQEISREQIMAEFISPEEQNKNGEKAAKASQLKPVAEDKQWAHGMYMIGQVASMHKNVVTIEELHKDVSEVGTELLESLPKKLPIVKTSTVQSVKNQTENAREPIAIIGMSCLFPKANDLHTFWHNILEKVDAIEEVPSTHWDWRNYYDPDPLARDKIYSKWGGFIDDVEFDPTKYGIPPGSLNYIDAMQLLLLEVTDAALKDAGYSNKSFAREKTSVILANAGHGPITAFYSLRSMLGWKLSHLSPAAKEELENMLPEWTEDTFPGYLGNVTAGRVCNRFDLSGINFSIDAACASSLAALYTAMAELRSNNSDVVFLAATDTHNQPGDYLSFSKTHALSPDGHCKTFDANANGIVISEGMAMLVLKRLSDAERDGDKIYAVIKGIGGSSDGRDLSLTAPRPAGQIKALHRAYEDAAISPNTVTLIEAHGTGTVAGDKAEVGALKQVFEQDQADKHSCAIGSVKTMIGHTKAAAGLASLIKVAKSLYHKVLPPTIGVNTPNPACHFETGPFYINSETRPWLLTNNKIDGQKSGEIHPRRAGVSAFGFGGTNFHAVLEEYIPANADFIKAEEDTIMPSEIFVFSGHNNTEITRSIASFEDKLNKLLAKATPEKLVLAALAYWQFLKNLEHQSPLKNVRHNDDSSSQDKEKKHAACLSIVANSITDLKNKLASFKDQLLSGAKQIKDPRGVYYTQNDTSDEPGKLAFLFPGQGSQYPGMLCDLAVRFAEISETFVQADRLLNNKLPKALSSYVFPTPTFNKDELQRQKADLTDTRVAQPAMGAADMAALSLVQQLGIKPNMVAGHSYGEYVALCAAGYFDFENLMAISSLRGTLLSSAESDKENTSDGTMAAVSCSSDELAKYLEQSQSKNITVANYNSPKQTVIAGPVKDIEEVIEFLQAQDVVARRIAVSQAFHTQSMNEAAKKLENALQKLEFQSAHTEVYSNYQGQKYEKEPVNLSAKLAAHTVQPVDFVKQISKMYDDGARIFLEVGAGNVLTNLAQATLEKHSDATCISLDRQGRDGVTNLLHALAQLTVNGILVDYQRLYQYRINNLTTVLDSYLVPDNSVVKSNKKLIYLVNGAGVRPKDQSSQNQVAPRTNAPKAIQSNAIARNDNFTAPLKTTGAMGDKNPQIVVAGKGTNSQFISQAANTSAEQIMVQFQQTMQEMANSFLETQQRVMLAFLENQNGKSISNNGQANVSAITDTSMQASVTVEQAEVSDVEDANTNEQSQEVSTEHLINSLVEIVAERTGYPVDMIDPNLDLEADLGIDSIKRVEILNKFRRLLPESTQLKLESGIEELAGTKTLQGIIDWFQTHQDPGNSPDSVSPSSEQQLAIDKNGGNGKHDSADIKLEQKHGQQYLESTNKTVATYTSNSVHTGSNGHNGKDGTPTAADAVIRRALVAPVLLPKLTTDHNSMSAKIESIKLVGNLVLITADKLGLAENLAKLLEEQGLQPIILRHANLDKFSGESKKSSQKFYNVNLENDEQVNACLTECENLFGKFSMLFHLQSFAEELANANRASAISLLHLLKYASNHPLKERRIIAATSMGGKFGIEKSVNGDMSSALFSPTQAAVVGLIKVAAKELPNEIFKAIDFVVEEAKVSDQLEHIASNIFNESVLDVGTIESGYVSDERYGLSVVDSPVKHDLSQANLNKDSVILITGGARGITAEIALELAQHYKPTLILVGRSELPGKEDSAYLGLSGAREIKAKIIESLRDSGKPVSIPHVEVEYKKLIKDREIRDNIQKLQSTATKVVYHNLDVRNSKGLVELVEQTYKEHGKIDAVIHSAGIIEDALIKDKNTESFCRVFDTKVSSALTLLNALKLESLKYLFLFSSVVGRTGNAGQSDYVAANEVLNKLALAAQSKMSGRAASIMWGPWRGGMAQPELEEIFAQYGWSMIPVSSGCKVFIDELLCFEKTESELLFVAELEDKNKQQPIGARLHKSEVITNNAGNREYVLELDTKVDIFLLDHAFDGIPVLPMAYALELMCEAAVSSCPDLTLSTIKTFDIPAGILFDSQRKKLSIIVQYVEKNADSAVLQVSIHSGITKRRENFKATFVMGKDTNQGPLPNDILSAVDLSKQDGNASQSNFNTGSEIIFPPVTDVYRQWLFHGPKFRGMQSINSAGDKGIWGRITGLAAEQCLALKPDNAWIIDPVMFDSAMQLGGIWARRCLDITVLPTGFSKLRFLQAPDSKPGNLLIAYALINHTDSKNELSCDLAIYNPSGELCVLVEGLTGVGNKSLHRLVAQKATAAVPK